MLSTNYGGITFKLDRLTGDVWYVNHDKQKPILTKEEKAEFADKIIKEFNSKK